MVLVGNLPQVQVVFNQVANIHEARRSSGKDVLMKSMSLPLSRTALRAKRNHQDQDSSSTQRTEIRESVYPGAQLYLENQREKMNDGIFSRVNEENHRRAFTRAR